MTCYDAYAETFSNSRKNMRWAEVEHIIRDIQKNPPKNIIDIGCGNGRFLEQCAYMDFTVPGGYYLGIDNSLGMIREAKKLHPDHEFLVCDMLELGSLQTHGSFEVIILLASFHHLESPEQREYFLREVKKLLTQNGVLYMTNWNLRDQKKYEKSHRGDGDFDIKIGEFFRYYHGFTTDELRELFEKTGWRVQENRIFEGGRNIYSKIQKN